MDLGLFLLLLGVGFSGIILIRAFGVLSIISGLAFVFLALAMFSGQDVQSVTHIEGSNATDTSTNSTTITTAHDEKTDWITSNQLTLGYLFEMLAFLCFALFVIVVVLGK